MKRCNCANFKKLIEEKGLLKEIQDWNFCVFCGKKMEKQTKKTEKQTMNKWNKCPKSIKKGHCEECLRRKLKACENCGNKKEVESTYTGDAMFYDKKAYACLCYDCRMSVATLHSLQKSW